MIRNIITAAILFSALVFIASIVQVASAVEPELNLEISAYENNLNNGVHNSFPHPFLWTPNVSKQEKIVNLYERLFIPKSVNVTGFTGNTYRSIADQRLFSFQIYQGDGLDDLRKRSKHHNNIILPDEDAETYGFSLKQRF